MNVFCKLESTVQTISKLHCPSILLYFSSRFVFLFLSSLIFSLLPDIPFSPFCMPVVPHFPPSLKALTHSRWRKYNLAYHFTNSKSFFHPYPSIPLYFLLETRKIFHLWKTKVLACAMAPIPSCLQMAIVPLTIPARWWLSFFPTFVSMLSRFSLQAHFLYSGTAGIPQALF